MISRRTYYHSALPKIIRLSNKSSWTVFFKLNTDKQIIETR